MNGATTSSMNDIGKRAPQSAMQPDEVMDASANKKMRVAIIGGGVAGLSAAYDLARQGGYAITVYEGAPYLGGLAAGFKGRPSWEWPLEHFYHHLFTNDDAIINLTHELGLSN